MGGARRLDVSMMRPAIRLFIDCLAGAQARRACFVDDGAALIFGHDVTPCRAGLQVSAVARHEPPRPRWRAVSSSPRAPKPRRRQFRPRHCRRISGFGQRDMPRDGAGDTPRLPLTPAMPRTLHFLASAMRSALRYLRQAIFSRATFAMRFRYRPPPSLTLSAGVFSFHRRLFLGHMPLSMGAHDGRRTPSHGHMLKGKDSGKPQEIMSFSPLHGLLRSWPHADTTYFQGINARRRHCGPRCRARFPSRFLRWSQIRPCLFTAGAAASRWQQCELGAT